MFSSINNLILTEICFVFLFQRTGNDFFTHEYTVKIISKISQIVHNETILCHFKKFSLNKFSLNDSSLTKCLSFSLEVSSLMALSNSFFFSLFLSLILSFLHFIHILQVYCYKLLLSKAFVSDTNKHLAGCVTA